MALLIVKLHMFLPVVAVGFHDLSTDSVQTLMLASRQHLVSIAIEAELPISSLYRCADRNVRYAARPWRPCRWLRTPSGTSDLRIISTCSWYLHSLGVCFARGAQENWFFGR